MLIVHVHVKGKSGAIEKTYDFVRNDGKDGIEGFDCVIPFDEEAHYPLTEQDVLAIISNRDFGRDN